jgi:CRP-like cAMP-binding protein
MNVNAVKKISSSVTGCSNCLISDCAFFDGTATDKSGLTKTICREQLKFSARVDIFQQGDAHDQIYTVYSGWGMIYKTVSNNSKRQILRFLLPGDLIGFQTNKKGVLPYSAATITDSTLCAYDRDEFKWMLEANPELAMRMLDMTLRDVSLCQNHLVAAGRKTAIESVAYVLLELFYRIQSQRRDDNNSSADSIYFPITQEDIGDAIGITNIHVNRIIKELMQEKLIIIHKKRLTILDAAKMREIAEFSLDSC